MPAWTKPCHLGGKPGSMWSTIPISGSPPSSTAPNTSASWWSTTARTTWCRRNRGGNAAIKSLKESLNVPGSGYKGVRTFALEVKRVAATKGKNRRDKVEDAARSVVAGAVVHGALRERENARLIGLLAGDGTAFLAGGDAAGVLSVLFAVDPLEEDVEQEVTSENAKR